MKNVLFIISLAAFAVSAATVFKGKATDTPYPVKRPDTWMFDVQIGASETVYSGVIDLLNLPLAVDTAGESMDAKLTKVGTYIGFCTDVSDSVGGADSALVSFLPEYSQYSSTNSNPNALQSDTWTAGGDSVQLANRSDSIYVAETAVKSVTLPDINTRWLRFRVTNRSATTKNAGQRCRVAVTFKSFI